MATRKIEENFEVLREELRTDHNLNRVKHYAEVAPKKLPSAAKQYFLDKLPIVQWLPRYSPSWLASDFMAGLTIGVMLIPQGLSYAKIATIPIEHGLYSSWVPAAVAVFLGTSKDLSTGPTSLMGLLTAEIVADLKAEYSPADIAAAVAFMVGVYGLVIGLLGLGFLLDYISIPILIGFISATALTIGFGQVGGLVGLDNTPSTVFAIIGDVLRRLPKWDGPTSGVGFGTVVILYLLEKVGKKWGKKHFVIQYISSSRAIIVLIIFTLISYLVNKDRDELLWAISKVNTNGIAQPKTHDNALISKVAARAIAPFIAASLEHQAVAKAFGRKNHYTVDQTQEFNYLGVTNLVNSFFGSMPVGGAMSRTAVNSECGVRSPLNGVVTAAWILLTIYFFSPALYWLPKATLSAIIIMAVIHLFGPFSAIYKIYRVSLADYIAFNVAFFVTIFVGSEYGIGSAAGWAVVWTLLRSAFVKSRISVQSGPGGRINEPHSLPRVSGAGSEDVAVNIPEDTVVVSFQDSLFYPNAQRNKTQILESIQLVYPSVQNPHYSADSARSWSVAGERRLARLRKERNVVLKDMPLSIVVLDFTMVPFIDMTGVTALAELKDDIHRQLGNFVEIRMVNMGAGIIKRFERAKWPLADVDGPQTEGADIIFPSLGRAIWDDRENLKGSLNGVVSEKLC
ncbi:sulfate permease [Xylaria bambusicola]|uniref:sulfate permease n=1 Tax=Xylaria bambusicola TaxID=326684 RepID=UPI002007A837|nr:sulfate permease [Xylaria bambusicola]KAI0506472.1 sulfate permease [Xylaria bambusicola]